ncbi:MAG: hypothetical protein Q3979_02215 [Actinomycetaceae bacterium]|nr:hypothetical protein [Actinomycetaceae bacterium]
MRIYIPATSADIGRDRLRTRTVHAVTPELREAMPGEEEEVLESVAMCAAADDSLRVLAALAVGGETIRPLRVVVAASVRADDVERAEGENLLPTARRLVSPLDWDAVDSIHVDDDEALDDLVAAIEGDDEAFKRVAEEDLMWFDAKEREQLVAYFS